MPRWIYDAVHAASSYQKSPDFGHYYPKRVALHIYMQHSHASR
jgi:hypothetical protein